jgi:cobalamin biosynthesis Mg chelatase CobN
MHHLLTQQRSRQLHNVVLVQLNHQVCCCCCCCCRLRIGNMRYDCCRQTQCTDVAANLASETSIEIRREPKRNQASTYIITPLTTNNKLNHPKPIKTKPKTGQQLATRTTNNSAMGSSVGADDQHDNNAARRRLRATTSLRRLVSRRASWRAVFVACLLACLLVVVVVVVVVVVCLFVVVVVVVVVA